MKSLYIIDSAADFKGYALTTMPFVEIGAKHGQDILNSTYVHYTDGKTFKQYNEEHKNTLIALTWEDFENKYLTPYYKSLQKEWKEETKEEFWDALECLPPCNWHNIGLFNVFFVSEAYTGDLHSWHVHDKKSGKYYTALRSCFIKDDELFKELNYIKSPECKKVLQLMDENGGEYQKALNMVLVENPGIDKKILEEELNKYI